MNLRQYKKLSINNIKKLDLCDGDILILYVDINKISPYLAQQFFDVIKCNIKKDIFPLVIPTDMFLEKANKQTLIEYVNRVQKYIDKLGE